ncbi:MAG: JAB domain-containing protein [Planctomycetota bacterium]|jgi:DNA repair protein RadC
MGRTDELGTERAAAAQAALLARAAGGRLSGPRRAALARGLAELGLDRAARLPAEALAATCGLTRSQANRAAAVFEMGREVERWGGGLGARVVEPEHAVRVLAPELRGLEVEVFRVLVLDARQGLIAHEEVSRGTLDAALVHPREVFRTALRASGASILVAHNHPSGDPEPSAHDWAVTDRLVRAGRVLGVPVTDHLVIAGPRWVSMRGRARWPTAGEERTRAGRRPRRSTDLGPRRA